MKGLRLLVALGLAALAGCATHASGEYSYFPDLARDVLAGDAQAFRQVLAQAESTPPGDQLEELAELSSRFVRLNPVEFLRAQATTKTCFGVSFMGASYVDNPEAEAQERSLRREALDSVADPALSQVQQRCLAELAGS